MSNVATTSGRFGPSALLTWANAISAVRLLGVPWLVVAISLNPVAWGTFVLAFALAASDGIDGVIARRQGATRSGAFLDPLADKALVLGALYALVATHTFWWLPVAIITLREFGISAYRTYWGRRGLALPARRSAKVKTILQELAIGLAILPLTAAHTLIAVTMLWVAVGITIVTALQYVIDGRAAATSMLAD